MKKSIVTSLKELRKIWRDNDFKLTQSQQVQYNTLLELRRAQVWDWTHPV